MGIVTYRIYNVVNQALTFYCLQVGYINSSGTSELHCLLSNLYFSCIGNCNIILICSPSRDPEWNLTEYVKFLRTELKCWRHVYWRLWGESHFLLCATCHIHYSVCQSDWCCYHSDTPQFFTMEQHRSMSFPIGRFIYMIVLLNCYYKGYFTVVLNNIFCYYISGRYPCCGERAYRFEVLQNPNVC